jgi:serine/threonine protein kinase
MGRVYRALDRKSGAAVAVKVLMESAEQHRERFAWEGRLLEQLRHPSIVGHVAHGFTGDGELYLAMEWLEGMDLSERLARGPLSVRDTLALAHRLLAGLAAAHELGVIHRDIKPRNVYLEAGIPARAKLLDFGIARLRGAAMTQTGHVLGTVGYMAPEQGPPRPPAPSGISTRAQTSSPSAASCSSASQVSRPFMASTRWPFWPRSSTTIRRGSRRSGMTFPGRSTAFSRGQWPSVRSTGPPTPLRSIARSR